MPKAATYIAVATVAVGLLLLIPFAFHSFFVIGHILLGVILMIMLIILFYNHVPSELFNPFRQGFKKWNGFKLFLYLFLSIFSGVVLLFSWKQWIFYFHGFIGLWSMLVCWKHVRYS